MKADSAQGTPKSCRSWPQVIDDDVFDRTGYTRLVGSGDVVLAMTLLRNGVSGLKIGVASRRWRLCAALRRGETFAPLLPAAFRAAVAARSPASHRGACRDVAPTEALVDRSRTARRGLADPGPTGPGRGSLRHGPPLRSKPWLDGGRGGQSPRSDEPAQRPYAARFRWRTAGLRPLGGWWRQPGSSLARAR